MLDERQLESQPLAAPVNSSESPATSPSGLRGWLLARYRFLYAVDLIVVYLSSMFYITARLVTGKSSVPSRALLVMVIGSGILAVLPLVTGANFEKDFVGALRSPQSKKFKRIEITVAATLLLILAIAIAVAISHPAHRVRP
jgi:hypothetical protein